MQRPLRPQNRSMHPLSSWSRTSAQWRHQLQIRLHSVQQLLSKRLKHPHSSLHNRRSVPIHLQFQQPRSSLPFRHQRFLDPLCPPNKRIPFHPIHQQQTSGDFPGRCKGQRTGLDGRVHPILQKHSRSTFHLLGWLQYDISQ